MHDSCSMKDTVEQFVDEPFNSTRISSMHFQHMLILMKISDVPIGPVLNLNSKSIMKWTIPEFHENKV